LVTARSAPAHERAIRTLMNWNIEVDEAMFLGGLAKGEFLREFEPDFFFDDQTGHVDAAAQHVPAVQAGSQHIVHMGVAAGVVVQIVRVNEAGLLAAIFNCHGELSIKYL
jgi:sorbitol-specific phosphotransferase system component IIC